MDGGIVELSKEKPELSSWILKLCYPYQAELSYEYFDPGANNDEGKTIIKTCTNRGTWTGILFTSVSYSFFASKTMIIEELRRLI